MVVIPSQCNENSYYKLYIYPFFWSLLVEALKSKYQRAMQQHVFSYFSQQTIIGLDLYNTLII